MKYPAIKLSSNRDLPELSRQVEERWEGASIEDDFADEASQMDLHFAVEDGNLEVCEYLIEELQINVDEMDKYGQTPLHHACMYGNVHVAEYLLQEGANPNVKSIIWLTPLHYAVEKGPIELVELLLAEGAEINAEALTGTPLHHAVFKGQEDIAQLLLDNNADRQRKMEEQFFLSKSKGTEAYYRADFLGTIKWYTEALYCKKDAAILSNLSACWVRLNEGGLALLHAQMCIHIRPEWAKGHYRKGVALMLLKYFDEAAHTFYKAFKMDPGDKGIERAYTEAATLASNWRDSSSFSPRMIG